MTTMIRPGLLVGLKTEVRGGVHYARTDLEATETEKRWETLRRMDDPEEHERAMQARGKASTEIRRVCSKTSFGLLCAARYEKELDAAIVRASDIVAEFNAGARFSRISLYVLKGRIAETDEAAARAIASEVRELLERMQEAVEKMDAEAVRDAATRAKMLQAVLGEEQSEKVGLAVEAARKAARTIVRRIEKKGEEASAVLAEIDRAPIEAARISFLDLTEQQQQQPSEPALPQVEVNRMAQLEGLEDSKEAI